MYTQRQHRHSHTKTQTEKKRVILDVSICIIKQLTKSYCVHIPIRTWHVEYALVLALTSFRYAWPIFYYILVGICWFVVFQCREICIKVHIRDPVNPFDSVNCIHIFLNILCEQSMLIQDRTHFYDIVYALCSNNTNFENTSSVVILSTHSTTWDMKHFKAAKSTTV